jgi:voltage-gated potassium channel
MLLLLKRRMQKWWSRAPWATLCALVVALYLTGYVIIRFAEPPANPIRSLPTYTYFFLVTITTVGYGDVVPLTAPGRLMANAIAVGGIGAAAVALGNVFTFMGNFVKRRERGFLGFEMKDHIVIFGNRGVETAALIRQLIADQDSGGTEIVLCSQSTERNPFPDFIDFVRGDPTSEEVMARACVKNAAKVIIHAGTDYESICIALAVKEVNDKALIVVRANDPGKEAAIERVDRNRVICVKAVDAPMIVREIHNPGITQVLENLLSPEGQDLRSVQVPQGNHTFTFGLLAHSFRERHAAILIGMRPAGNPLNSGSVLNPAFNTTVEGGMFLDYIARHPAKINWAEMQRECASPKP